MIGVMSDVRPPRRFDPSADPDWARRGLSIVIAVVADLVGLGLLFSGGSGVIAEYASSETFGPGDPWLILAGVIALGISAATIVLSTAGVAATSLVKIALSVGAMLVPFAATISPVQPATWIDGAFGLLGASAGDQAAFAAVSGFLLLTGAISLTTAVAVGGRRRARVGVLPVGRIVGMASALLLGIPSVVLAWAGAESLVDGYRRALSDDIPFGPFLLMLAGVALSAAVVYTARWSSAGLYAFGLYWLVLWIAVAGFLSVDQRAAQTLTPGWLSGVGVAWALSGFALAVSVQLLVSGSVARVITRAARTAPHLVLDGGR